MNRKRATQKKKMGRGEKERNDWTEDGRYPSRFYKTSPSVKQQAETLIVEEKIVKGTAGEIVREQKQDRYKDRKRKEIKMRERERDKDKQKDPNLPTEQGGAAVKISKPSPPNYR